MPIFLPTYDNLKKASAVLKKGGIIAYPTETFYGLGVDPFNEDALKKLFELKGRGFDKPVSILVKDENALASIVEEIPSVAKRLFKRFWPGPLTIVFKAKKNISDILTASTGNIGVRVSSSPVAKKLLDIIDAPITATSANPSGEKSPVTPQEVERYFGDKLDMIIDGGELEGKLGSTIVDVTEGSIKILRQGEIPEEKLYRLLKNSTISDYADKRLDYTD
ncbi:MAG: threonylcarbamoyl-AMP synthase [Deltaproteobacteria bacterium]|nr:threonylcarbamoyl-AMP synthase [Deltaproteobacteria bacterium]